MAALSQNLSSDKTTSSSLFQVIFESPLDHQIHTRFPQDDVSLQYLQPSSIHTCNTLHNKAYKIHLFQCSASSFTSYWKLHRKIQPQLGVTTVNGLIFFAFSKQPLIFQDLSLVLITETDFHIHSQSISTYQWICTDSTIKCCKHLRTTHTLTSVLVEVLRNKLQIHLVSFL